MANKETKELFVFMIELGNAIGKSLADGKFDLLDALKFYRAVMAASPALKGAKEIPSEIKSWSEADRAEILELIKHLDLPDDEKEDQAEKILATAVVLADALLPFINMNEKA